MSLNSVLRVLVVCALVGGFCADSFAQGPGQRGPLRNAAKFFGSGWGVGNHWRNPTVNPDYYNPYTPHNSVLSHSGVSGLDSGYYSPKNYHAPVYSPPKPAGQFQSFTNSPDVLPTKAPINLQPRISPKPKQFAPSKSNKDTALNGFGDFDGAPYGLFEQPVIGDRKYRPHAKDSNTPNVNVDPENFWPDK